MRISYKNTLQILIYLSIILLVVKLVRSDVLKWPETVNYRYLVPSLIMLFLSFVIQGLRWHLLLRKLNQHILFKYSYISNGLTILGKYIPGKIWMIIGKAMYIVKRYDLNVTTVSMLSAQNQVLALWSGFFVGSFLLFDIKDENTIYWSIIVFTVLTLILWSITKGENISAFIEMRFGKAITIPTIKWAEILKLLPIYLFYWLLLLYAFKFMAESIGITLSTYTSSVFVLSAVIGIVAIIAPGGLGVREGIMITILISLGFKNNEVISLSAFSRVWFLIGEVLTFMFCLAVNRFKVG